jgi:SSS family solute:Na+ symporter
MISSLDTIISVFYIVLLVSIGFLASARIKKARASTSSKEYFLAGNTLKWPMIGLALFATNISCIHLVSLAQSGFDTGLLNGNFEWMASFTLILLALFFVPFYLKSKVSTLPEFLEKRYNKACRNWLTIISIVSAILIHISFSLLAGGIVIETLFGIDIYISVTVISVLVALYTLKGGLHAVVVTESIQTVVLVLGAIIITVASYLKIGGWDNFVGVLEDAGQLDKLSMLRSADDPVNMPWYAVMLGYPVLGIWYWCADQTIVQRVLGAKDINHAKTGALFCGFIKILPVFIFVFPGLIAYALVLSGGLDISSLQTLNADGSVTVNSKGIYTVMITQLLPSGLIGIVIAALLSGLMSQVSGALNSISTLVSYDIVKQLNPSISDKALVKAGRITVGVGLLVSIALLPLLNNYESLFNGFNDIIAHIAPPITCVFLLGVFWKKATATSAKWTLWIGSFLGVVFFSANKLAPDSWFGKTPFMMMAFYLFLISVFIQVIISVFSPASAYLKDSTLYWKHPLEPLKEPGWKGWAGYRVLSLLLLVIMICCYSLFA